MNAPRSKRALTRAKSLARRTLRSFFFETLERREVMAAGSDPLILIPGFGGTFAANETSAGVNAWLANRGQAPSNLQLEPFSGTYQNIVQSLRNVGYADSGAGTTRNLFVVNWDWRLPAAPTDANSLTAPNGEIAATAASITDANLGTGLDYLGNVLADVRTRYGNNAKVDIVAHGLGGVIARSYIQSAAYRQAGLPAVDDLTLVAVPNEGMTDPFNFSGNDWSNKSSARMTSQIVDRAYDLFLAGTTINGPSGAIPASLPKTNEVQRVGWTSTLGATGTFTLSFNGATTAALTADATAATVQTALQGLATVGAGNAQVELLSPRPASSDRVFKITFTGARGGLNQPQATINIAALTTGSPIKVEATDRVGGENSLEAFTQLYVGSLANLLPTYDSIDTNNDGIFEKLSTTNPAGNTRVNALLLDLNGVNPAAAPPIAKNSWADKVLGKTHVVYSTEVETRDRLIPRTGPSTSGAATDEIRSFQDFSGRRPTPSDVWFEDIVSGHGGDGTVPTFSTIDPFLGDRRIGSKLILTPIVGKATGVPGVTEVSHNELMVNPFAQTKILTSVGAHTFTNANLVTNLVVTPSAATAKAISTGLLRPADAIGEAAAQFRNTLSTTKATGVLNSAIAYTSTKLGELLPIDTLWQDRVVTPLTNLLTTNASATIAQIVAALNVGLPGAFFIETDSGSEKSIRFDLNAASFAGGVPTASGTLNLGSGFALSAGGNYTLTGNLTLSGVLGIDMAQGDNFADGLFVRDLNLVMGASGSISNLNASINIGTLSAGIENGNFSLSASANIGLKNASPTSNVSLSQIVATPFADLIGITPTASVDMRLPLNITNTATGFNLANFGRPVISAASTNLFVGTPDVIVDIEIGPTIQDQILTQLGSLDAAADDVSSRSAFNQVIPGIGQSLNGLINEPGGPITKRWGDLVKFEKAARDYFDSFNPSSNVFNPANVGSKPTALGFRNAITAHIDTVTRDILGGVGISLKGGLDLATNKLQFDLAVNGTYSRSIDLNIDSLGLNDLSSIGVELTAAAKINVATAIDIGVSFGVGLSQVTGVSPFFTLNRFNVRAAVNGDNSSLGFSIANGTIGGTITAASLRLDAGVTIAMANTAGPIANRITITPSGSLNLNFLFNASLYGAPLVAGAVLPSISFSDPNIFDSNFPAPNVNLAPLFLNLSSEAIVDGLLQFASWLNDATGSDALNIKIPLLNKTVGELLSTPAEARNFDRSEIISITGTTVADGFKRFTAQINLGGKTAASIGIKPDDKMMFLATSGEFYEGIVDTVEGEEVTIRYEDSRTDEPELEEPELSFEVGGTLGDTLKSALVNFSQPGAVTTSLAALFNELAEPLGIKFNGPGAISYDNATKRLLLIPSFTPKPYQYATRLDFGDKIAGLEFNASGDFIITATPTIRLPIEINLNRDSGLTLGNRVAVLDESFPISGASNTSPIVITTTAAAMNSLGDGQLVNITGVNGNTSANGSYFAKRLTATTFSLFRNSALTDPVAGSGAFTNGGTWRVPEVGLVLSAQLDNPQARASLGFISGILTEDAPNNGIVLTAVLGIDVKDPTLSGAGADGRATITELTTSSNLTNSFTPSFTGSLDIAGLRIRPEVAGTPIPGEVTIFSTDVANPISTTTRAPARFGSLPDLRNLFNKIFVGNTIGTTESLTPEAVATMFVQLGKSVQEIAGKFEVPEGIPFVKDAISGIIDFSQITQNFARQLYFNPKLIGANDISITNGRLTSDATFAIRIEGGEPAFVTISAASTATNNSIDDLYADINAALVTQGFGDKLVAERQLPYEGAQISAFTDITAGTIPNFVQPLPAGFQRWNAVLPASVDLFNLGIRVGDVIEYLDTTGTFQKASVDQMTLNTLSFRFNAAVQADGSAQAPPDTSPSNRSIALFDTANQNKLAIRTTSPTAGISLELSTVQVTAPSELPTQLTSDLTMSLVINGTAVSVPLTAASTKNNAQPSDMVVTINTAFANTNFNGGKLDSALRARLDGDRLRIFAVNSETQTLVINGATVLGFTAGQTKDENTAQTELGLGSETVESGNTAGFRDGMLASPTFRAGTIQDLVHVINGMLQNQIGVGPFSASLVFIPANESATPPVPRSVQFNIKLGTEFEKSIDLNFDEGVDVGFTQLSVAGGASATLTAAAGVELTVGIDLDPIGVGDITRNTSLSTLNQGRGAQVKTGLIGTAVNSSGRNDPATALHLNFTVHQYGNIATEVNVTIPAADVGDNVSLDDLAADLNVALKARFLQLNRPGLRVVEDLPPIEVQVTSDGKLYLVSNATTVNGITIIAGPAASATSPFLGFAVGRQGNIPDLQIQLRDGRNFLVNLDRSETLGNIETKIETEVGGDTTLDVMIAETRVTAASNTTPIVLTTASTAGLRNGQQSTIAGVLGNTNANGARFVKVLSATTFELYADAQLRTPIAGNGVYTGGGTATLAGDAIRLKDNTNAVPLISGAITGASNANPIVITTASTAGLVNTQRVTIENVLGNTAANGTFYIKVINATTFELYQDVTLLVGQSGSGAFVSGGTWTRNAGKLQVMAVGDNNGVSPIGSLLGIIQEISPIEDDPNTPDFNEANDGTRLIGTPLLRRFTTDQFYVLATGSRAFANVTIASTDIDLVASLGILDLGIVDGVLNLTADASINLVDVDDPETGANESTDGKLRLSDFSLGNFKSIIQPSFTYGGEANLPVDGSALVFLPKAFSTGVTIAGATNASPIVITTTEGDLAGIANGQSVDISGVLGNTAANGTFAIQKLTPTTFALVGSTGNGAYAGGGVWKTPMSIEATLSGSGFTKPTITFGVNNLQAALETFKNFSVADLVGVIQRVVELLQNSDIDGLNTPIPVINQTPNDILNVVGGLAKAAEELLAGPDLDLLNAKILELETLLNSLGGTPEQNDAVMEQIRSVKATQNPDHVYKLDLPQFALAITGASNPANSAIVITTSSTSRLTNGQSVTISNVGGNTNANGTYFAKVITATTFEIYTDAELTVGRRGNGAYTSGGIWQLTANDITLDSAAVEVFDELTRIYGVGVIKSVTGDNGGPYEVTFEASRGNVNEIKGTSGTGLTVQTRTLTQGVANTTSEVQQ